MKFKDSVELDHKNSYVIEIDNNINILVDTGLMFDVFIGAIAITHKTKRYIPEDALSLILKVDQNDLLEQLEKLYRTVIIYKDKDSTAIETRLFSSIATRKLKLGICHQINLNDYPFIDASYLYNHFKKVNGMKK